MAAPAIRCPCMHSPLYTFMELTGTDRTAGR